jgi:hypothetical protein
MRTESVYWGMGSREGASRSKRARTLELLHYTLPVFWQDAPDFSQTNLRKV